MLVLREKYFIFGEILVSLLHFQKNIKSQKLFIYFYFLNKKKSYLHCDKIDVNEYWCWRARNVTPLKISPVSQNNTERSNCRNRKIMFKIVQSGHYHSSRTSMKNYVSLININHVNQEKCILVKSQQRRYLKQTQPAAVNGEQSDVTGCELSWPF